MDDAKSTPNETSFPNVNPRFSHALADNSRALSFVNFGAQPPSSPRPFVKLGSVFTKTERNSL